MSTLSRHTASLSGFRSEIIIGTVSNTLVIDQTQQTPKNVRLELLYFFIRERKKV